MSDARYLLSQAELCFRLAGGPAGPRLADELEALGRALAREARRICERGRYSAGSQGSAILDSVGGTTERTAARSRSLPHRASDAAGQAAFRHSGPASCAVDAQCRGAPRQPARRHRNVDVVLRFARDSLRWREMDSNLRFPNRSAHVFETAVPSPMTV
jgi:hypothetical protein